MKILIALLSLSLSLGALAAEEQPAKEGTLNENQELPQILYVVPWKDVENAKGVKQKLVLHDFFTDLYDPVLPTDVAATEPLADSKEKATNNDKKK